MRAISVNDRLAEHKAVQTDAGGYRQSKEKGGQKGEGEVESDFLPNFSTGVFSGRNPCLRSWSIISSSSVWISDTMLQGIRPTRSRISAR